MPRADLVTIGEAFEDLVFADLPRLPGEGEEVRTERFLRTVGGGAVITAVAASRAGLRCAVISGLSDDAKALLKRERIAITNLRKRDEPHAVTAALSTRDDRGFVTFPGVNAHIEPRLVRAARRVRARHVHFALCPRRCSVWQPIVDRLRSRGITTSWDFGWNEGLRKDRGFTRLAASVDYLMVNDQEAIFYSRTRSLTAAVAHWRTTARALVVKMGKDGSRWVAGELDLEVRGRRTKALETTGAGDSFNGGFLAACLSGANPRQALAAGNRMGALSTRQLGGIEGLPRRRAHR